VVNVVERGQVGEKLPKGWKWVKLGNVCKVQGGFAFKSNDYVTKGNPIIRISNLIDGKVDLTDGTVYASDEIVKSLGQYKLSPDNLLIAMSGATTGKLGIVPKIFVSAYLNQRVGRFVNDISQLDIKYLGLFLSQPDYLSNILVNAFGSAIPNVSPGFLESLDLLLPPLPEQKRIAGILSDRLTAIDKARTATEVQLKAAKALPAAYLRQVFDSPEAQKWKRKKIGDVCELLPAKSIATEGDTEVLAITMACLSETGFQPAGIKRARMRSHDAALSRVASGEVLIARSNTSELVGRVAIYSGEVEGVVASDLTIRIKAGSTLKPTFLTNYLSSLYIQGYWKERAGGASDSMKKITRSQLIEELIPVPALAEQNQITIAVAEKLAGITALKQSLQFQLTTINQLPAAILRQAFNGEL